MNLVYADFMKIDREGRLPLVTRGTFKDLEKHGIALTDGLRLVFYNEDEDDLGNRDDLVVEGIVHFDEVDERWIAVIHWDAIKNISKLSSEERRTMGFD